MNAFLRSWELTKVTAKVIQHDKELIVYPILSAIFSLIFIVLMTFSVFFTFAGLVHFAIIGAYFIIAFFATFFNVCTVYTAKTRFEGGNATITSSIEFAMSRIVTIFYWSVVAATVGILLKIISGKGNKIGQIISSLIGMAWGIVTIFVIPSLVYHDLKPWKAIKKSIVVLKKTWGESLIRYIGFAYIQGALSMVGFFIAFMFGITVFVLSPYLVIPVIVGFILYLFTLFLFFNLASAVFNTALYVYADSGKVPHGFKEGILKHAFKKKD